MSKQFTRKQIEKIEEGKEYIQNSNDADSLYILVLIVGPLIMSKLINRSGTTIWNRVTNPGKFSLGEMRMLCKAFSLSLGQINLILDRQIEHNLSEIRNVRPVGKERYKRQNIRDYQLYLRCNQTKASVEKYSKE